MVNCNIPHQVVLHINEIVINFTKILQYSQFILMVSSEAFWWNILQLKIYTTLGYIVSQIRIISHMCIHMTMRKQNTCPKYKEYSFLNRRLKPNKFHRNKIVILRYKSFIFYKMFHNMLLIGSFMWNNISMNCNF